MLAVNSAKCPHVDHDDFSAQVGETQGRLRVHIQPNLICQFGGSPEDRQGGGVRRRIFLGCGAGGQQE